LAAATSVVAASMSAAGLSPAGVSAAGLSPAGMSAAGVSAAGVPTAGVPAAGVPAAMPLRGNGARHRKAEEERDRGRGDPVLHGHPLSSSLLLSPSNGHQRVQLGGCRRAFGDARDASICFAMTRSALRCAKLLNPLSLFDLRGATLDLVSRVRNSLPGSRSAAPGKQGATIENIGNPGKHLNRDANVGFGAARDAASPFTCRCGLAKASG